MLMPMHWKIRKVELSDNYWSLSNIFFLFKLNEALCERFLSIVQRRLYLQLVSKPEQTTYLEELEGCVAKTEN